MCVALSLTESPAFIISCSWEVANSLLIPPHHIGSHISWLISLIISPVWSRFFYLSMWIGHQSPHLHSNKNNLLYQKQSHHVTFLTCTGRLLFVNRRCIYFGPFFTCCRRLIDISAFFRLNLTSCQSQNSSPLHLYSLKKPSIDRWGSIHWKFTFSAE